MVSKINVTDEKSVTGKWNGYQWKLEDGKTNELDINNITKDTNIHIVSLAIGQLEKSKDIIIYYKIRGIENGKSINDSEIITYKVK